MTNPSTKPSRDSSAHPHQTLPETVSRYLALGLICVHSDIPACPTNRKLLLPTAFSQKPPVRFGLRFSNLYCRAYLSRSYRMTNQLINSKSVFSVTCSSIPGRTDPRPSCSL